MILSFLALMIPVNSHPLFWLIPFILYSIGVGIGEIMNFPFLSSLALARSNSFNSGSYMGLFALTTSLAFTFAPIIGTRVVSSYGFTELWAVCIVMLLISIILFTWLSKRFLINDKYK